MKTQIFSRHSLVILKIGWLVFILVAMQPAAIGQRTPPQRSVEESVRSVVTAFLNAWRKGDYATAHSFLDSKTRRAVTPDQLRNSFRVEPQGTTATGRQRLQAIAGSPYLTTGRPMLIKAVHVRTSVNSGATADAVVEFNPLIDLGLDSPELITKFLSEFLTVKKGDTNKGDGFARAMGVIALTSTETVNTAKGQTRDVKGTNGPPYVVIHLRRFHLIKESEGWRINNAVTISSEAPAGVQS